MGLRHHPNVRLIRLRLPAPSRAAKGRFLIPRVRIVQVLLSPQIGGAETLAASLDREWSSTGHWTRIVYLDPTQSKWSRAKKLRELRRTFDELTPDLIIAHSALPSLYSRIARRRSAKLFSVLHSASDDFADWKLNLAERLLSVRTDLVVGVGHGQISAYKAHFGNRVDVRYIPNGVSPEFRPSVRTTGSSIEVVTIGRIVPQKNPDLWRAAAESVTKTHAGVSFTWYGPENSSYEKPAIPSHLSPQLRFAGPTTVPSEVLRRASLLFHPASREANSIVLLEAATIGVPIVCSENVAKTLPENVVHVTFADDHHDGASESLRFAIENLDSMTAASRKVAPALYRSFSISNTANSYIELYLDIVKTK
nr:glycosyltransferase [Microcella alkalica]